MGRTRKIKVAIDEELLKHAQKSTGENLSETVRQGLRLLATFSAFRQSVKLRGKVRFSKSWNNLKYDR